MKLPELHMAGHSVKHIYIYMYVLIIILDFQKVYLLPTIGLTYINM